MFNSYGYDVLVYLGLVNLLFKFEGAVKTVNIQL